jgi:hypothetical protein
MGMSERKQLLDGADQDIAPSMTKTRQVNFRFEPNTFRRLQRQAEAEHRTVSNLVEKLVLEYLEHHEAREPRKPIAAKK